MANKAQALKYIRKSAKRAEANRHIRSELRTLAKKVKAAQAGEDKELQQSIARQYVSCLDKAVKRNVIHINKASRHKASVSGMIFAA